jgi:hypothetical protein
MAVLKNGLPGLCDSAPCDSAPWRSCAGVLDFQPGDLVEFVEE